MVFANNLGGSHLSWRNYKALLAEETLECGQSVTLYCFLGNKPLQLTSTCNCASVEVHATKRFSSQHLSAHIIITLIFNKLAANTFKYHVSAPMGRFQLELIYLYFPTSFHLIVGCFCPVGLSLL